MEFEPVQTLEGHENEVKCIAWSHQEEPYLATCSRDKQIWIYEADEDEDELDFSCLAVLSGHSQDVKYVKWHPERNQLYSASYDDTLKCWSYDNSVDDWICSYTMNGGHTSTVWCFDFNQSGTHMVSCSEDKTWILWSITPTGYKKIGEVSNTHFRSIYSISWCNSATVNRVVTSGADN